VYTDLSLRLVGCLVPRNKLHHSRGATHLQHQREPYISRSSSSLKQWQHFAAVFLCPGHPEAPSTAQHCTVPYSTVRNITYCKTLNICTWFSNVLYSTLLCMAHQDEGPVSRGWHGLLNEIRRNRLPCLPSNRPRGWPYQPESEPDARGRSSAETVALATIAENSTVLYPVPPFQPSEGLALSTRK